MLICIIIHSNYVTRHRCIQFLQRELTRIVFDCRSQAWELRYKGYVEKVAISVNGGQVAVVFDFARSLLVMAIEGGEAAGREVMPFAGYSPAGMAKELKRLGVSMVICGAISRPAVCGLQGAGIEVVPNIRGPVEEVLEAYLKGRLNRTKFLLPGCAGRGQRRRRGYQCGRGRVFE